MTTIRETIARRIAARKTGINDPTGARLPDDIWRQALPYADDALAALGLPPDRLEAVANGTAVIVDKEPTQAMDIAIHGAVENSTGQMFHQPLADEVWAAALAAAASEGERT